MQQTSKQIIAICGHKHAGKDTVANIIKTYIPNAVHLKFATPLKSTIQFLFNFSNEQIHGNQKDTPDPKLGVTPRHIMQWFGTEIMQFELAKVIPNYNRTFWAQKLCNDIQCNTTNKTFIISDLRFKHEIDLLKTTFPGSVHTIMVSGRQVDTTDLHESEQCTFANDDINHVIVNNKSMEHLENSVVNILNHIGLNSRFHT